MSLNNISLPPQLLADLYQHSLVEGPANEVPQKPTLSFLGKGAKGILILVDHDGVTYLPDGELQFLTKILSACQFGLADVAIVNWHKSPRQLEAILDQVETTNVIVFGIEANTIAAPVDDHFYALQKLGDKKIVMAPPLAEIEKTREAKGQLWIALKEMFGL